MKRFELFEYDKETERRFDFNLPPEELEEANLKAVLDKVKGKIKGAVNRLKRLFDFGKMRFGQTKRMTLSIDIPSEMLEAADPNNTGNTRKLTGPQVEYYSCLEIGKRLPGFNVVYKKDGSVITPEALLSEAGKLQSSIEQVVRKKNRSVKKNKDVEDPRKQHKIRQEYGVVTGERVSELVKKQIETAAAKTGLDPSFFTIYIDSVGEALTGIEKTDIQIDVYLEKEDAIAKKMGKSLKISHKANQDTAFGTQTSATGMLFYILSGQTASLASRRNDNPNRIPSDEQKKMVSDFGKTIYPRGWDRMLEEFRAMTTNVKLRDANPAKFTKLKEQYYNVVAQAVNQNEEVVYKMIGVEKGVEHFYINRGGTAGDYLSYYSGSSKWYKSFYNNIVKNRMNMEVTYDSEGVYISLMWGTDEIWHSTLSAMTTGKESSKKSSDSKGGENVNIRGLSATDLSDAEQSHRADVGLPAAELNDAELKKQIISRVKANVDSVRDALSVRDRNIKGIMRKTEGLHDRIMKIANNSSVREIATLSVKSQSEITAQENSLKSLAKLNSEMSNMVKMMDDRALPDIKDRMDKLASDVEESYRSVKDDILPRIKELSAVENDILTKMNAQEQKVLTSITNKKTSFDKKAKIVLDREHSEHFSAEIEELRTVFGRSEDAIQSIRSKLESDIEVADVSRLSSSVDSYQEVLEELVAVIDRMTAMGPESIAYRNLVNQEKKAAKKERIAIAKEQEAERNRPNSLTGFMATGTTRTTPKKKVSPRKTKAFVAARKDKNFISYYNQLDKAAQNAIKNNDYHNTLSFDEIKSRYPLPAGKLPESTKSFNEYIS